MSDSERIFSIANAWLPPRNAVTPVNHFHTLYMRLSEISHQLLLQARQDDLYKDEHYAELLGSITGLGNECARLTKLLVCIQERHPDVWAAWLRAVEREMGDAEA